MIVAIINSAYAALNVCGQCSGSSKAVKTLKGTNVRAFLPIADDYGSTYVFRHFVFSWPLAHMMQCGFAALWSWHTPKLVWTALCAATYVLVIESSIPINNACACRYESKSHKIIFTTLVWSCSRPIATAGIFLRGEGHLLKALTISEWHLFSLLILGKHHSLYTLSDNFILLIIIIISLF